jgi:hypothetical protein
MLGDNAVLRSRFGQITRNLKAGQTSVEAFTKGLGISLEAGQNLLERYRKGGKFEYSSAAQPIRADPMSFRPLPKAEVLLPVGGQCAVKHQLPKVTFPTREMSPPAH